MKLQVYMSCTLDVLAVICDDKLNNHDADIEMSVSDMGYIVVKSGGRREQDIIKAFMSWLYDVSQL